MPVGIPTQRGVGSKTFPSQAAANRAVKSQKPGGAASASTGAGTRSKTILTGRVSAGPGKSAKLVDADPGVSNKLDPKRFNNSVHGPRRAPKPSKPVGAPATPKTTGFDVPKPTTTVDHASAAVRGGIHFGAQHAKNNSAVPILLFVAFLIVGLAKIRGLAVLDVPKAFFGGFVLTLILLLINMWSSQVAIGFAALVLIQVLLEYGPAAFKGVFSGKTTLPTSSLPIVSGINENVPAGLQGAIGGDINSHPDSLPAGQGSLSDAFGRK